MSEEDGNTVPPPLCNITSAHCVQSVKTLEGMETYLHTSLHLLIGEMKLITVIL